MLFWKDKRIKACWNPRCKRCKTHYKYTAADKYCSLCRRELVFVCSKCGGLLEDEGRRHRVCYKCIERKVNNAENRKEAAANVVDAMGAIGSLITDKMNKK